MNSLPESIAEYIVRDDNKNDHAKADYPGTTGLISII